MTLREIVLKIETFMNAHPDLVDVDVAAGEEMSEFLMDLSVTEVSDDDGSPRPYLSTEIEWR